MTNKEIKEAKEKLKETVERKPCPKSSYCGVDCYSCLLSALKTTLQYIEKLENKVKALSKGQHTLMQSRRKWENRYYKEKRKNDNL